MLDMLSAHNVRISGRFTLLGAMHRRLSGQGLVEFAVGPLRSSKGERGRSNPVATEHQTHACSWEDSAAEDEPVAIKFYIVHAAFDRVASLWSQPRIRSLMTVVEDVVPQGDVVQIPEVAASLSRGGTSGAAEAGGVPGGAAHNDQERGVNGAVFAPAPPPRLLHLEMLPMVVMKRSLTLQDQPHAPTHRRMHVWGDVPLRDAQPKSDRCQAPSVCSHTMLLGFTA